MTRQGLAALAVAAIGGLVWLAAGGHDPEAGMTIGAVGLLVLLVAGIAGLGVIARSLTQRR